MNLLTLLAKLGMDSSEYEKGLKDAESSASSFGSKTNKILSGITKAVAAASAAAAGAVTKLTYDAVKSYGNYEQLIGGVETLFKDSADIVSKYADNAYMTAGLSANQYMETVTSFSASLLQSLGGDTERAAQYADLAITDMSDNANKMGSSMESIQFAYQGFAKQNYTMLDNLKLGYGGTKTEMERLILDAEKLDGTFQASRDTNGELTMSYADIVDAIHIVQTDMGITGTTAKEAATTIEGSLNSMKAAWRNLVTGFGSNEADIGQLVDNFTVSFETVFNNIAPVVENAVTNMSTALPRVVSNLLPKLTQAITNMLPSLMTAVTGLISSLAHSLPTMVKGILNVLPSVISDLFSNIGTIAGELLPALASSVGNILVNLPSMIVSAAGGLVDGFINMFKGISDAIKFEASASIPDDLADGYVGKVKSNFEKSFDSGMLNLKMSVAKIIGDTNWADALAGIKLATEMQDKIITDFNTFQDTISQYSFENFQFETEAQISTAMSLLGALKGMIDKDGNITGSIQVAQGYIDQINSLLGSDAVKLNTSLAEWIIEIAAKYQNEDGTYSSPEKIKDEIKSKLLTLFNDPTAVTLAEQTYNVVSKVLSKYSESDAKKDKDKIRDEIQRELEAAGVPSATAKIIANGAVEEGAIETWYRTGSSSSWDNSAFIQWLQQHEYLPTASNPAQAEAIAEVATKFVTGEIDDKEFRESLEELGLTDDEIEQLIKYTVDYSEVTDAIEAFKELTKQKYLSAIADAHVEAQVASVGAYTEAMELAAEAQEKFNDGINFGEIEEFNGHVNTATVALNAQKGELEDLYGSYWDFNAELQTTQTREEFIAEMLANDEAYQNRKKAVDDLRLVESAYALQLVESAGGFEKLGWSQKEVVAGVMASVSSWKGVQSILGTNSDQTKLLSQLLTQYYASVDAGMENTYANALNLLISQEELTDLAIQSGIPFKTLAQLLFGLAQNEDLVTAATNGLSEAQANGGVTMDGYSTTVGGLASVVKAGLKEAEEAASESGQVTPEEYFKSFKKSASKPHNNAPPRDMAKVIQNTFKNLSDTIGEKGAQSVAGFTKGIISGSVHAKNAAHNMESDVTGEFDNTPSTMQTTGKSSGTSLKDGLNATGHLVKTVLSTIEGYFHSTFSGVDALMYNFGKNAATNLKSGLSANSDSITKTLNNISGKLKNSFGGISLYSVGTNAMSGLTSGLNAGAGATVRTASNIAERIVAEFRSRMQIKSPSRVFWEIGEYIDEGLALGISDNSGTVINEMGMLSDAVQNGLSDVDTQFGFNAGNRTLTVKANDQQTAIYSLLTQYLPQLANMEVTMDSNKTVGVLMPKVSREMKNMETSVKRGNAVYA